MTRRSRRSDPTPEHEPQEPTDMPEPTDTTDPVTDALLSGVSPDLITAELRHEVTRAALACEIARQVADASSAATGALATALMDHDVSAAITAAGVVLAAEHVASFLPSSTLDPSVVAAAMSAAAEKVKTAERLLPPLPVVAYTAELQAFRAMNPAGQQTIEPPIRTNADQAAVTVADHLADIRVQLVGTVTSWIHDLNRQPDPIVHLAAAGSIIVQLAAHRDESIVVIEAIDEANAVRHAAELTWQPPDVLPGFIFTAR